MQSQQSSLESLSASYSASEKAILDEFFHFLRFPSVSAVPEHKKDVLACADWVKAKVKALGFKVETWETPGYPVIFAENLDAGPNKPTLLIYNHYDVQPVDPLEEWQTGPFEPQVRGGQVYARGAQDNKGQCFYCMMAVQELMKRDGKLPLNVKWLIEGEEEVGSANLPQVLRDKSKRLQADFAVIVDVGLRKADEPAVTLGVRGLVTMDVEVKATKTDLHSGSHGGLAYNPNRALVEILAKLRDSRGKIAVPGFFDDVVVMTPKEREGLVFDFDEEAYTHTFGAPPTGIEPGYSPAESNLIRPTIEINGVSGGYSGPGFKTVIPAKASARVSCRLVPHQDPKKIVQLVAKYLESLAPEGLTVSVKPHRGGGPALRADPHSRVVRGFSEAYSEVLGAPCRQILEGASIPITPSLAEAAGVEVLLLGYALPTDQIHAPNEHFGVDRLRKGCLTMARAMEILAKYAPRHSK